MSGTRDDLVDRGIFVPATKASPATSRKPPTLVGDESETTLPAPQVTETLYGVNGHETTDAAVAAARRVVRDGVTSFEVRVGTSGSGAGSLYDPRGIFSDTHDLVLVDRMTGRRRYEFKAVAEAVFNDHVYYLQSHAKALLRNAERVMRHG